MHLPKRVHLLISIFPAPNTSLVEAEAPTRVRRVHCPDAGRAYAVCSQGKFWNTFESSFFLTGYKYRSHHSSQKVKTQGNLFSTVFRIGSAAESTFNLLSNYIMEQGTNYCLFSALLKASFTGFILLLNHFSSSLVFLLKSHF